MKISTSGREHGVALIVALVFLLIITLVGLAAARTVMLQARLSTNLQSRTSAVQAAEAALRYAEAGLLEGLYTDFAANASGLYTFDSSATTPWYHSASSAIPYAGPSVGMSLASQPQLVIEQMPSVSVPGQSISMTQYGAGVPLAVVYRITASATGGDSTTSVKLQSIVH